MRLLGILAAFLLLILLVDLFVRVKRRFGKKASIEGKISREVVDLPGRRQELKFFSRHFLFFLYYLGILAFAALILKAIVKSPPLSATFLIMIFFIVFLFVIDLAVVNFTETRLIIDFNEKSLQIKKVFTKSESIPFSDIERIMFMSYYSVMAIGAYLRDKGPVLLLPTLSEDRTDEYLRLLERLLVGEIFVDRFKFGLVTLPGLIESKAKGFPHCIEMKSLAKQNKSRRKL